MLRFGRSRFERDFRRKRAEWPRRRPPQREVAMPAAVLMALERFFGDGVRRVRVIEHSRHWTFWQPWFAATTRKGTIYLRDSAEAFLRSPEFVLEEYYHVLRQWESGELTRWRYVLQWLRYGYAANAFEVAAKRFARERAADWRAWVKHDVSPPGDRG